jgi:hypothetical protein
MDQTRRGFALAFSVLLSAPMNVFAKDFSVNLYSGVYSKLLMDNGVVFHDGPVMQNELLISLTKGFYLDLWHSMGMNGSGLSSGLDDRLAYTVGWRNGVGKYSFDAGVTYIDMVGLLEIPDRDILLPYLEVNRVVTTKSGNQIFSPYCKIQPGFPANGSYPAKGFYIGAGLRHSYQIGKKFYLKEELALIRDSGAFGFRSGALFKYDARVNRRLFGPFSLDLPMLKFTAPFSGMNDRKIENSIGVRLGMNF